MFQFYVPEELCDAVVPGFVASEAKEGTDDCKAVKKAVREIITEALDEGVPALTEVSAGEQFYRVRLPLPPKYARLIKNLAKKNETSDKTICEILLTRSILTGKLLDLTHVDNEALSPYLDTLGFQPRPEQSLFYEYLTTPAPQKVRIIEASTGVGKSLGMLAAAVSHCVGEETNVLIAAPTLALIKQLSSLYLSLRENLELPPLQVIFGRGNFVAIKRLKEALKNKDSELSSYKNQIEQWMSMPGPYMLDDLSEITPLASIYALSAYDSDDPSDLAYKEQFIEGDYASVFITTHAMLAANLLAIRFNASYSDELGVMKKENEALYQTLFTQLETAPKQSSFRKEIISEIKKLKDIERAKTVEDLSENYGILPDFRNLIVDEAHALDNSMDMVFNARISLRATYNALCELASNGVATQKSVKDVKRILDQLVACSGETLGEQFPLFDNSEQGETTGHLVRKFGETCAAGIKESKTKATDVLVAKVKAECKSLANVRDSVLKYRRRAILDHSPVVRYPRVLIGRRTLQTEYELLWSIVDTASLVSGVLYVRQLGGESSKYIRGKLAITRYVDFAPIKPPWITAAVKTCRVPKPGNTALLPPSRRDKLTHAKHQKKDKEFHDAVALELDRFIKNAAGGTLVLCTSYRSVELLSERIKLRRPLVLAESGRTINSQKEQFCSASLNGERPLWLAVGGAWTGLDINGEHYGLDVKNDNLLTDIVITKIPFASKSYGKQLNTFAPALEASFLLKQGIGRLVRREGVAMNRRILLTDARLNDTGMKAYMRSIKTILSAYPLTEY